MTLLVYARAIGYTKEVVYARVYWSGPVPSGGKPPHTALVSTQHPDPDDHYQRVRQAWGRLPDPRPSPHRSVHRGHPGARRCPRCWLFHVPYGEMARSQRERNPGPAQEARPNEHAPTALLNQKPAPGFSRSEVPDPAQDFAGGSGLSAGLGWCWGYVFGPGVHEFAASLE